MSEERRIAKRVAPSSGYIAVLNRHTGQQLGSIANISETGFMLVGPEMIDIDSVFQFELKSSEDKFDTIQCGAVCLWNADTSAGNAYWSGFHIIDISDQAQSLLNQAIDDMAAN